MNTLIKRYLSFSIGIWLKPIIFFITVPVVSWLINPSEFGKASMYSTFYSILTLVVLFGTSNAFMRFYFQKSEKEKSELLGSCLSVPLILWVITGIILSVKNSLQLRYHHEVQFLLLQSFILPFRRVLCCPKILHFAKLYHHVAYLKSIFQSLLPQITCILFVPFLF